MTKSIITAALAIAVLAAWPHAQQPGQPPAPQQPSEVSTVITTDGGGAPRLGLPEFVALSNDAETVATAKTISQVLWDDLNFEREFAFIPRDVTSTIPKPTGFNDVAFDRWQEVNADALVVGTVTKQSSGFHVELKLFKVSTHQSAYSRAYDGSNPRLFAHTISDELHKSQRGLVGVARTRLTFDSDRDGERMGGTVQQRSIKEIYISDYDGENQKRVTVVRNLSIAPRWSPDGRSIAYTSYRRGGANIFISNLFQGTLDEVTKGDKVGENWLPAWSPDGTKLAFSSTRDGNPEIYIVNRDGSGLRRLTNSPTIDITPTWSPSGTQIAFTSDRSGSPQIYVVGVDGLGLSKKTSESFCDRPTWSPAPFNEIAYAARSGPGFDIHVLDLSTGAVKALTFGEGTNESPAFSPNGRHIVFTSTRSGKTQVFTMARDGKNVRPITKLGNNEKPDWSK
jgi:TolB protein